MTNWQEYFKDKKITVMGLGLLGRGVGDVKFLASAGADLLVTDVKTEVALTPSLKKLAKFTNINYRLGGHHLDDFRDRDFILKGAGVPLDSEFIAEARRNNIPVLMSTALFVKLLPPDVTVVGVTGTRGKTTTTYLIYEILKTAGWRVYLGGNIQGVSTLALLKRIKSGDAVVLELDSWQLQGFGDLAISPHLAVFTNFLPDHLNYYHGDMERYFSDKANIFKYQKADDYLICGAQIAKRLGRQPAPSLPKSWRLKLLGEHNRINASLAKQVAGILAIKPAVIKKVITNFSSVTGRLQLERVWRGIKIYNDTTSTTPSALGAALGALGETKANIILIAGGADKTLDFTSVVTLMKRYCREIILLPGTGTAKLIPKLALARLRFNLTSSLREAVDLATREAKKGEVILFSPGFASFGLFQNEYDRGDQFNRLIKKLK